MVWSLQAKSFWTQTLFSGVFFLWNVKMQMAVIMSKSNEFLRFFLMDTFVMISPFHLPYHLGAKVIINGARAVQTV